MKCRKCEREFISERYLKEHMAVSHPKPVKPPKEPKVKTKTKTKLSRNKWVKAYSEGGYRYFEFTELARKSLRDAGEDMAWDGLGNYVNVQDLETAAYEIAMDHPDLDDADLPKGHVLREIAADIIYDGMLKGKARVIAEGRSLEVPRG
jgi:hypothetical protein